MLFLTVLWDFFDFPDAFYYIVSLIGFFKEFNTYYQQIACIFFFFLFNDLTGEKCVPEEGKAMLNEPST